MELSKLERWYLKSDILGPKTRLPYMWIAIINFVCASSSLVALVVEYFKGDFRESGSGGVAWGKVFGTMDLVVFPVIIGFLCLGIYAAKCVITKYQRRIDELEGKQPLR